MDIWSDKILLEDLEELRNNRRGIGKRLTFDCMELRCSGDRVYCARGKDLSTYRGGTLALITVLRGVTSPVCINCQYYHTEEESKE